MINRRKALQLAAGAGLISLGLPGIVRAQDGPVRLAMVIKALGINFFDSARAGGEEACAELSKRYGRKFEQIFTGPNQATAEEQLQVIQALVNQRVDAIAIAADDANALVPVTKRAMQRGIKVISWDSPIVQEGRILNVNPTSVDELGARMLQLMGEATERKGEFVILSSTPEQAGQNAWMAAIEKEATKPNFASMKFLPTIYSNSQFDKAYREVEGTIRGNPNLKGVIAIGTLEHAAAAKAVVDGKLVGKVFTSGLGLPSQMRSAIEAGACQSFALWNNVDLGYTVMMISGLLAMNEFKGEPGSKIDVGRIGSLEIGPQGDLVMGPPLTFDKNNIAEFSKLF